MSSEPIRQPANDLVAFNVNKQSAEQIANLFARWKEQRKQAQQPSARRTFDEQATDRAKPTRTVTVQHPSAQAAAPVSRSKRAGMLEYSSEFAAVLAAPRREEPVLEIALERETVRSPPTWPAVFSPAVPQPASRVRSSSTRWMLAGAACVFVTTAVYGVAQWKQDFSARSIMPTGGSIPNGTVDQQRQGAHQRSRHDHTLVGYIPASEAGQGHLDGGVVLGEGDDRPEETGCSSRTARRAEHCASGTDDRRRRLLGGNEYLHPGSGSGRH